MAKITINDDIFQKRMKKLDIIPELSMKNAYIFLRNKTPIQSGNARNKTKRNNLTIKSDYPYADRLDTGWSKQAPKGFTGPTQDYLDTFIQTQVGKI